MANQKDVIAAVLAALAAQSGKGSGPGTATAGPKVKPTFKGVPSEYKGHDGVTFEKYIDGVRVDRKYLTTQWIEAVKAYKA